MRRTACRRHRRCRRARRATRARELDAVQRELRDYEGVSVLIYDQVCATEKRRRRKRGKMAQPTQSVVINEQVCENCGDCSAQSGCIAIEPVETSLGRKRRINPTSCNVDLSCLKGFCPSFVTVAGPPSAPDADPHWQAREDELSAELPQPSLPATTKPWRALFAGIGGGGIVTSGAILAMAAHLEGKAVRTLDFTGLAQKNGTVVAHVQIADDESGAGCRAHPARQRRRDDCCRSRGRCRAGRAGAQCRARRGDRQPRSRRDRRVQARRQPVDRRGAASPHHRACDQTPLRRRYLHAVRLAEHLFGNAQAMNTMLLGLAWQRGLVPVGEAAILRAIELNGAAVCAEPARVPVGPHPRRTSRRWKTRSWCIRWRTPPATLDALIEARAAALVAYQNPRWPIAIGRW